LSTGNVPVKVGVIISFIGVAFFLKYAIDREILVLSLEFRLLAVTIAGLAMITIGWRLREKTRGYALSLQGGGAGILFITLFGALWMWQMLPAPVVFSLMVVVTLMTGALAVIQNARSLAIFAVIGGFLAPVLTDTWAGNHVLLFGYYLVLNATIVGIAWFRAWRELNLVGFFFTFGIGSLWGYQYYRPELLTSTLPFLVLYFLFYQVIAILHALRQPPDRLGFVEGTLVFGTPVIVFALQAALVNGIEYALAISAAAVAVFYLFTALWLNRSKGEPLRLLSESFIALGVAFLILTVPLAFDARWTSAAWALEGAALVWVGVRQSRNLAKLAGSALILLSGIAFMKDGWLDGAGLPILNGNVIGGALISLSAWFASRKLDIAKSQGFTQAHQIVSIVLFVWGTVWWLGTGLMEAEDRVSRNNYLHVFTLFLVLSVAAGAWLAEIRQWATARRSTYVFLPLLGLLAIGYLDEQGHFLVGLGALAWPLAWIAQIMVLRLADKHDELEAGVLHLASLLMLTGMLAIEIAWRIEATVSATWGAAAATIVTGTMALLVWGAGKRASWPVPAQPWIYLTGSIVLVLVQVLYLAGLSVKYPGDPAPLVYLPLLNPFDLAMMFAILTAIRSLIAIRRDPEAAETWQAWQIPYRRVLAGVFLFITTFALIRAVHHYGDVAWNMDDLFGSVVTQTVLSIYWGLLGFTGMIWGARKSRRPVWLAGAGFMALVVIKLFLVDLGNSGTVARIISFIGIGALLLVVGYFAPAPPRLRNQ
jgi:uncharacterized membrane protein